MFIQLIVSGKLGPWFFSESDFPRVLICTYFDKVVPTDAKESLDILEWKFTVLKSDKTLWIIFFLCSVLGIRVGSKRAVGTSVAVSVENIWVSSSIPKAQTHKKTHLSPQVHLTTPAPTLWLHLIRRHPPILVPVDNTIANTSWHQKPQQQSSAVAFTFIQKQRRGSIAALLHNGFFFAFQKEGHLHASLGSLAWASMEPPHAFFSGFSGATAVCQVLNP